MKIAVSSDARTHLVDAILEVLGSEDRRLGISDRSRTLRQPTLRIALLVPGIAKAFFEGRQTEGHAG